MLAPGALTDTAGGLSGIFASIKTVVTCSDGSGCTTVIISDTQELESRMKGYLGLVLLVLVGVSVLGYLVTYRLQRIITDPLISLVNTMERIRATRDYSLRVGAGRTDEIGILADCFNQMLCEVQTHGEQLHLYQDKLSELIAIRTAELVRVKEEAEATIANRLDAAGQNVTKPVFAGREWTGTPLSQDERRMLYALMDCIDDEVWFISARPGLVMANRTAGETLGVSLSDCLDQEAYAEGFEIYYIDLNKLRRADLPPFCDLQGTSVRRMEVALLTDGDVQRFQLINAEPYRNREGELSGTVFVATDITGQKESTVSQRAVSGRLIEGEESLRKSLAAELHDEIGRDLAAMHIYSESIRNSLPAKTRQRLDDKLCFVHNLLDDMSCKVANIVSELRPPLLDDFGLVTALKALADTVSRRHLIEVDLLVVDEFPPLGAIELSLYRIAQEAINNAVKHSGATSVLLILEKDEKQVRLVVFDNGCGFDPGSHNDTAKRPSWGMTMMRERAESCGGSFSLESTPGKGTRITAIVRID